MTDFENEQYFKSDEFKELLKRYEDALSAGDSLYFEPDELTSIAEYYQDSGHDDKSMAAINTALTTFPGSIAPLVFRSRYALLRQNNPGLANEYADQIEDVTDYEYYYLRAEILLFEVRPKEADAFLEESYTKVADDEEGVEDFLYDVINLYIDYGEDALAAKWLERVDKESRDYDELSARLFIITANFAQSEELCQKLVDEEPFSVLYWQYLATAQLMQDKLAESVQSIDFALAICPDYDEAMLLKANALVSLNESEKALELYQRYQKKHPNDANAEVFIASALIRNNNYPDAIPHYKNAIHLCDTQQQAGEVKKQLALAYSHERQVKEALDLIKELENMPEISIDEVNVVKGYIYMENNLPDAHGPLNMAILHSNRNPHILYQVGVTAFDNNHIPYAYLVFKQLIESHGGEGLKDGWAYYAWCCEILGYKEDMAKALKNACAVNPTEVRMVFEDVIPHGTAPNDYYNLIMNKK